MYFSRTQKRYLIVIISIVLILATQAFPSFAQETPNDFYPEEASSDLPTDEPEMILSEEFSEGFAEEPVSREPTTDYKLSIPTAIDFNNLLEYEQSSEARIGFELLFEQVKNDTVLNVFLDEPDFIISGDNRYYALKNEKYPSELYPIHFWNGSREVFPGEVFYEVVSDLAINGEVSIDADTLLKITMNSTREQCFYFASISFRVEKQKDAL